MISLLLILSILVTPSALLGATETPRQSNGADQFDAALFDAVKRSDSTRLELLVQRGANPNSLDEDFQITPLFYAVERGDFKGVRLLLDHGANPNVRDQAGNTPLIVAAALRAAGCEIIRMLVAAGADIDAQTIYGDTALHVAASRGLTRSVLLLTDSGARRNIQFGLDRALVMAAAEGDLPGVKALVQRGANPDARPVIRRFSGELAYRAHTPLVAAVWGGHENVALALLEAGADNNLTGEGGWTPLIASVERHGQMTKLLLDRRANPDTGDDRGKTALMHSISARVTEKQRLESVSLLIKAGVNVNSTDKSGRTAAQLAITSGNIGILPVLIDAGARLDRKDMIEAAADYAARNRFQDVQTLLLNGDDPDTKDKNGQTALMHAAQRDDAGMTKILLYIGCKADLQDNDGMTALMHAARLRRTKAVHVLLSAGADPNIKDKKGTTALLMVIPSIWAALDRSAYRRENSPDNLKIIQALIASGADPNISDADGLTPLILASGRGQPAIVSVLLAHGADLRVKGPYGTTAYHVAAEPKVIELLKKAGAKN